MSEQNRVAPDGRLVVTDVRGAWLGNRGSLHDRDGRHAIVRTSATRRWITCVLSFRERRVEQWVPGHYTPLFFLDEAVALAAGHRPCAECRRPDFSAFCAAWAAWAGDGSTPRAGDLDDRLHAERGRTHTASWADLPTGAFVVVDDDLALVRDDDLVTWDEDAHGYAGRRRRPTTGTATVRTPSSTVAVLRAGYPAQIDVSAG